MACVVSVCGVGAFYENRAVGVFVWEIGITKVSICILCIYIGIFDVFVDVYEYINVYIHTYIGYINLTKIDKHTHSHLYIYINIHIHYIYTIYIFVSQRMHEARFGPHRGRAVKRYGGFVLLLRQLVR